MKKFFILCTILLLTFTYAPDNDAQISGAIGSWYATRQDISDSLSTHLSADRDTSYTEIVYQDLEVIRNLSAGGNVLSTGDTLRISGGIIVQHDGTLPTWDHNPGGVAIKGISEFDDAVHFDGAINLYYGALVLDNVRTQFGTGSDMSLLWDTNASNDDIGILRFVESNGTNIPILIISDVSFSPNGDSRFDDITEPAMGFVDDDADSYFRIGFIGDDQPGIVTNGDIFTINGTQVNVQESYALANEINGILSNALAIYVWVTPTTTEADQSGEGHTATYVNVDADDWLRHGSVRSIHLETGEYMTIDDHADFSFLSGTDDASVSFGGRALFHDDTYVKTLMAKYDPTNGQAEWFIQCNTDEKLYIVFYDEDKGAADEGRESDVAISAGWHDWVITYDGSEQGTDASDGMAMYIDGQLIASSANDTAGDGYVDKEDLGQMVSIGTRLDSDTAGDHWMDDMSYCWFDQSKLSAADVFTLWSATRRYVDMDSGIDDNDILEIDQTDAASGEYLRLTSYGAESRSEAEFKADYNLEAGVDFEAYSADIQYIVGTVGDDSTAWINATASVASGDLEKIRATVGDDSTSWINVAANIADYDHILGTVADDSTAWKTAVTTTTTGDLEKIRATVGDDSTSWINVAANQADYDHIVGTVGDDSTSWIAAVANINFAGIYNHDTSDEVPIYLVDVFELIDTFTADMPEAISNGDYTVDNITVGASGVYEITYHLDFSSGVAAKQYRLNCYEIPASNSGGTITGITAANPGVVTTTSAHLLSTGDDIKFIDVEGTTQLNENIYEVGTVTEFTFQILTQDGDNVDTSAGHGAWTANGTVYESNEIEGLSCTIDYGVQDDVITAAATGFVSLTSGNTLEIYIRGVTDDTNPTMESGQFTIKRIQ